MTGHVIGVQDADDINGVLMYVELLTFPGEPKEPTGVLQVFGTINGFWVLTSSFLVNVPGAIIHGTLAVKWRACSSFCDIC